MPHAFIYIILPGYNRVNSRVEFITKKINDKYCNEYFFVSYLLKKHELTIIIR